MERTSPKLSCFVTLLALPVVLLLVSQYSDSRKLLKTSRPWSHMMRGLVGISAMACFFISFKLLPLGDATALHFASPIILTALSVPFLGEKVGKWRWGAVFIGLIGVVIIANPAGNTEILGSSIALMAALLAAIAAILVRRMGDTEHSLTIVLYFTICGIIVSLILCPFYWQPIDNVWVFYALITIGILGGDSAIFFNQGLFTSASRLCQCFLIRINNILNWIRYYLLGAHPNIQCLDRERDYRIVRINYFIP